MAKKDPDYDPKTKTYSKAHNEAKYRKQREAAEKGAASGNKSDLQTAEKIYKKKYGNAKDIGTYNKKTSDLSEKYASKTGAHAKARGEAGDIAAGEAETAANIFGGGLLGKGAKAAIGGISKLGNLSKWGSGAARTGKEAEGVAKATSKAPEAAKAATKTDLKSVVSKRPTVGANERVADAPIMSQKRTATGNMPSRASKDGSFQPKDKGYSAQSGGGQTKSVQKPAPKEEAKPEPKASAAPKPKASEAPSPKASEAPSPKAEKTAKPDRTPAPAKTAAPGDSEAVAAYRTGTKGSDERKAAWGRMTKEEKTSYQAARGPAKPSTKKSDDAAPAAPKAAKKTKAGAKAEAATPKTKTAHEMSDDELHAYMNDPKSPKDSKGRVMAPGSKAPETDAEPAPKPKASPAPAVSDKNMSAREKIKANVKAKNDAENDAKNLPDF